MAPEHHPIPSTSQIPLRYRVENENNGSGKLNECSEDRKVCFVVVSGQAGSARKSWLAACPF